jgi:hypothetical protein
MRLRLFSLFAASLLLCQAAPALAEGYDPASYPPIVTQRDVVTQPLPRPSETAYSPQNTRAYAQPMIQQTKAPDSISLGTQSSFDVGLQFSGYDYKEPKVTDYSTGQTLDVDIHGLKYGIDGRGTFALDNWFVQIEGRFAGGDDDYKGSGKLGGVADDLSEARLLGGHDFYASAFGLSPYTGIAFRDLFNDGRGTTSTDYQGYRRESEYLYLPLGMTTRTRLNDDSRVALNLEYDQVVWGRQYSHLGDVAPELPTLTNDQKFGYGFRGDIMYEARKWGIGPFFDYWNIDQSKEACGSNIYGQYIYTECGVEPHNRTIEYGLQFRYRLF